MVANIVRYVSSVEEPTEDLRLILPMQFRKIILNNLRIREISFYMRLIKIIKEYFFIINFANLQINFLMEI